MPALDQQRPVDTTPVSAEALTRLHISPLSPDLLRIILPSAHTSAVDSASYQTVQTFPENSYGFVSLPTEAAQALRKKYNGAHLRGSKMRIEEARPEKKRKRETEIGESAVDGSKKSKKRDKKHSKLEEGTLPAVELAEGRHVKRGWTESAKEKKRGGKKDGKTSRSREKGELAFRTQLPDTGVDSKERKAKIDKRVKPKKNVELTEFDKTTQFPSFLKQRSVDGKEAAEFIEGKGWIDTEGNVIEHDPNTGRKTRQSKSDVKHITSSLRKTDVKSKRSPSNTANTNEQETTADDSDNSSALSSSSASSISSESEGADSEPSPTTTIKSLKSPLLPSTEAPTPTTARRSTSTSFTSIPEKLSAPAIKPASPATIETTADKPIHPLEALFKRPFAPGTSTTSASATSTHRRAAPAPINTTFAFGFDTHSTNGNGDGEVDDANSGDEHASAMMAPPQTPFTRQDRFQRSIRSAAPTPDTAAIGRRFSWKEGGGQERGVEVEEDEEDGEEEGDDGIAVSRHETGGGQAQVGLQEDVAGVDEDEDGNAEQNEFEKHFYAHRGEFNKAWKARRREARKEVRQAENRKVGVGR